MRKFERVELAIADFSSNSTLLTKVQVKDIFSYAKEYSLTWKSDEIGVAQKRDLIKSIVKHNPNYALSLSCL